MADNSLCYANTHQISPARFPYKSLVAIESKPLETTLANTRTARSGVPTDVELHADASRGEHLTNYIAGQPYCG